MKNLPTFFLLFRRGAVDSLLRCFMNTKYSPLCVLFVTCTCCHLCCKLLHVCCLFLHHPSPHQRAHFDLLLAPLLRHPNHKNRLRNPDDRNILKIDWFRKLLNRSRWKEMQIFLQVQMVYY